MMLWLVFALIVAMILYLFIDWAGQRELRDYARSEWDADFRAEQIAQLTKDIGRPRLCPALYQRRGQLHYFSGDIFAALADAEKYTQLAENDREGWAELAEYNLLANRLSAARQAIDRALRLKKCDDYWGLATRIFLAASDWAAAADALKNWRELDNVRIASAKNQSSRFSFSSSFFPSAKIVPDPAIDYYAMLLSEAQAPNPQTQNVAVENFLQSENNADYWQVILTTRIYAMTTEESLRLPEFLPERWQGGAQYAAQLTLVDTLPAMDACLVEVHRHLAKNCFPQTVAVLCRTSENREEINLWLKAREHEE